MPTVPFGPPKAAQAQPIDPTFAAMAAAEFHEAGMLFETKFDPVNPQSDNQTKNIDGLRGNEQRAKDKLQNSRDEFDRALKESNENSRKFYEENTPEMLGPELEKLYNKEFGPRRPKQKPKADPSEEPMS